jgi:hypothetical protein
MLSIAAQVLVSRSTESLRLRLTTEGQTGWYSASVDAPPSVHFRAGATTTVPVRVTNTGRAIWDPIGPHRFRFSYHWLLGEVDAALVWEGLRTDFERPVAPGESVTLEVRVRAPERPGEYRLQWDIEQESRLWFSREPNASIFASRARVEGAAQTPAEEAARPIPARAERPGRMVLWAAAGRMLAAHPLTGVGPDNFRLLYGGFSGLPDADPRVHSNNMYLELLVGGGLLGGVAGLWLAATAIRMVCRAVAAPRDAHVGPGVVAASVAIAAHGLVDSFLAFTPTYILIAVAAGLAVAVASPAEQRPPTAEADAHRV